MTKEPGATLQFYLTSSTPCPYLLGRQERKVFTHLVGRRAAALNDLLTLSGFRRSQTIAYRPACEDCSACVSVRILASDFAPNRNMRRILKRNADLTPTLASPQTSPEHYALFRTYLDARHSNGGMADMNAYDFSMMVEESHIATQLIEYRKQTDTQNNRLLACCITDFLSDGLSMVYSFYDPVESDRSLGTYMILDHIERARMLGAEHVYLGYWIEGSRKMDYKSQFTPQERLTPEGWERRD